MLTVKQEKYVQNLVNGMSQRDAYKNSYNAKNMKDATIDNKASELFKKGEVRARYEELVEQLKDNSIMSAKERMQWLTEVIKDVQREGIKVKTIDNDFVIGEGTADLSTKMKAIDILNRMDGQYVTKLAGSIGLSYEDALKKVSDTDEY